MIPAQPPLNEAARLQALRGLDILDTPSGETFDRLTRLTASMLEAPVAMISLVDANRQWFKSRVGWDKCETDRDSSFCAHAILQPDLMIIPDTRADPRFAGNPIVTAEPYIRFYAGAPLITEAGHALGTLCVLDTHVRELTARQRDMLRDLASLTTMSVQLHRQITALAA